MKKISILVLICIFGTSAFSQFIDDPIATEASQKGLSYLYGYEFDKAASQFAIVKGMYPNHPVKHLLSAFQLQFENLPIENKPVALKKYIFELNKCIEKAKLLDPKYKKEAGFFLLSAHGYLALSLNYRKQILDAAIEGKKVYNYMIEGKKYSAEVPDYLFLTGIYNYYREQYPQDHPIIKPLIYFFEKGNKKVGLSELEKASKQTLFSRVEASSYLINIYIKYENNFKKALAHSSTLFNSYPKNNIFLIKHIECLLLNKEYEKAMDLNQKLEKENNDVSRLAFYFFEGYTLEFLKKDPVQALGFYSKVAKMGGDRRYSKEYQAMAYLGIARYMLSHKEEQKAKIFYKKSLEYAEYKFNIAEAENGLKVLK